MDSLTEALLTTTPTHPRADGLLAVLAEDEPLALCRSVDRRAHDGRPRRRAAAAAYEPATARTYAPPPPASCSATPPRRRRPPCRRHPARQCPGDAAPRPARTQPLPARRPRLLPRTGLCSRLPAAALVAALPVPPDQDAVFAPLRARADGEVVRALAALTT
ncbi:hypothetical protein [Streptomyces sp. NPDC054849]